MISAIKTIFNNLNKKQLAIFIVFAVITLVAVGLFITSTVKVFIALADEWRLEVAMLVFVIVAVSGWIGVYRYYKKAVGTKT